MRTDKPTRLRRRKSGDIHQLRRVLWGCLLELEADILDAPDANQRIRAAHALGTISGAYLKALELADLETRLAAIEARLGDPAPTPLRRTS